MVTCGGALESNRGSETRFERNLKGCPAVSARRDLVHKVVPLHPWMAAVSPPFTPTCRAEHIVRGSRESDSALHALQAVEPTEHTLAPVLVTPRACRS